MLNVARASAVSPISMGRDRKDSDPRHGFPTFGEFALAVRQANLPGGSHHRDARLDIAAAAPTTVGAESPGADGGFLVPPQFAKEIFTFSMLDDALLQLCDVVPIEANSMVFPIDEGAPWGTDGIRAYWTPEVTLGTQTKPKTRAAVLRMQKLLALVPLSDELLEDASALNAYLPRRCGDSIRAKVNDAILWGLGDGTPLGAFSGSCSVIAPKDAAQPTLTLTIGNLANMAKRLPQGSWNRAVFLINNDSLLGLLALGAPMYAMADPPPDLPMACGSLFGLPVVVSQHAKAFSAQGDVLLVDLSYYLAITKAVAMQTALSLHIYFDADSAAFRVTFRIDGQPKIENTITPLNGANQLSPFIQLAAR